MALLQLFSVVTSIHRLSTIRHLVILQKVYIVYTSMPFMTFVHIPVRTRSCSRFTIRMNSKHSVQLWTVIPFLRIPKKFYIGDSGSCHQQRAVFSFSYKRHPPERTRWKYAFPKEECFDITVNVTLVISNSSSIDCGNTYRRYIDANTSFDFLEYGSKETCPISFRVTGFELSEGTYECLVTNLPCDEFPAQRLKELYFAR